jgi:endonuclease-3
MIASADPRRIRAIVRRLEKVHGPRPWRKHGDPIDGLVATILSQNTSDTNSHRAFTDLKKRFPNWNAVRTAPVRSIAAAIKHGGLAKQKAPRIKRVLQHIHDDRGQLSLDFLARRPLDQARAYLSAFDGVGPKTVACVLMFNFNKPALPVDTHVHRIAKRLALISPKTSADKAHELLEAACPDDFIYPFHVLLIQHGRTTCKAQRPLCKNCALADLCPSKQLD